MRITEQGWHPWTEIRYRPVTSIIVFLIGMYMIWFGFVLLHRNTLPCSDFSQFSGPLLFWDLDAWGYVYIALGLVKIFRLLLLQYIWVTRVLHLCALLVLMQWAVAIDSSQMSLMQPASTLVLLLSLFNPWITNIIVKSGEPEYLLKKQRAHDAEVTSQAARLDTSNSSQQVCINP